MKKSFLQRFAREAVYMLIGLVIAGLSVVVMTSVSRYLLENFSNLQNSTITARCERVLQAFSQESDHLLSMLSEYSYWDATYDFEKGKNPQYIEEEFTFSTMIFGRINNMILFNKNGKYVGGASLQGESIIYSVPREITSEFEQNEAFLHPSIISQGHVGFLRVGDGYYLFACRSVSNTDLDAPAVGSVVFGRLLDQRELDRLRVLTGVKLKMREATGDELSLAWHTQHSVLMDGSQIAFDNPLNSGKNFHADILVKDIAGEHNILVTVEFPADIIALITQAVRLINFSIITMVFVSLVFALILIAELSRRRLQLQQQMKESEELEKAKMHAEYLAEQATTADKAKSQFLAIMSHEVRTPLNAIIGFSNLLRDSELSNPQREQIDIIRSSGEILLRVINDILDFSKIEAGKLELDNAECHLDEVVEDVREMFLLAAKAKHLDFQITLAPNVPRHIVCDRTRLLQVLGNLISNAIKFTNTGSVGIEIDRIHEGERQNTDLVLHPEDEWTAWLRFRVKDTGIGISREAQDKLFQAFSQVDSTMGRKYGGSGLGLVISRKLCHMMDGDIGLEKSSAEGSVFSFTIKAGILAQKTPEGETGRTNAHGLPMIDPIFKELRVLLVEDNVTNRKLMVSLLGKFGIVPRQATDGVEALALVMENQFDGIFMDLQMPEMDGFICTEKVREYEVRTGAKPAYIIALTAAAFPEDMKKCFEVGMDAFLSKPIKMDELQRMLEKLAKQAEIMTGS